MKTIPWPSPSGHHLSDIIIVFTVVWLVRETINHDPYYGGWRALFRSWGEIIFGMSIAFYLVYAALEY